MKKYIPECEVYKIFTDKIYYILIMHSSFDNPEYSANYISINIKKFVDIISNKSNIELIKIILEIKNELNNEINNLKNKFNYIWQEIYYDKYTFEEYDNLQNYFNKYFLLKEKEEFNWLNEFKTFLKDNLFDKQRKVEFLFYGENQHIPLSKDINRYPYIFYNNYFLNYLSRKVKFIRTFKRRQDKFYQYM